MELVNNNNNNNDQLCTREIDITPLIKNIYYVKTEIKC